MPPQGESTGLAIEDAILLARIFERRESRSVERLFLDFEAVRESTIEQYHKEAMWAMRNGFAQRSWYTAIVLEWFTWIYLLYKRWVQVEHFAGDVREIALPA
jgi:2-polyprenyl-6-methoxyphenol hydroxylase-like FAD-dependent oxidoreductase